MNNSTGESKIGLKSECLLIFFFSENGDSVVQTNRESLVIPKVILNVVDDLGNYL
jgi:hypothetical protein